MSWGDRRKHLIEFIFGVCAIAVVALVCVAIFYKAPSCMDGKQDQGEEGIDCGGPCPFACNADETSPSVRFARAVSPQPGRSDLVAYVDNSNSNAELDNAQFTVQFFGTNGISLAQRSGTITIPPSTTAPIFIPDVYNGTSPVTQVFLSIQPSSYKWLRTSSKPVEPIPDDIQIMNGATPKITATLTNPTAETLYDVTVVATVFNADNNAIGASQTVVQEIPPQGVAPIIFTWNKPFSGVPARVEILPAVQETL